MGDINYMDPQEFISEGYLHEANRILLHPLGLALQANPETGEIKVWDYRDDPEGMVFGHDLLSAPKAENVARLMLDRREARKEITGYVIQPVDGNLPTLTTTYIDPSERTHGG